MSSSLYALHSRALGLLYAELESYALALPAAFLGTAGTVLERSNAAGFRFYAHQSYDALGKKRERYLAGPIGDQAAEAAAAAMRARILETKEVVPSLRLLAREGFSIVDAKTYGVLAALSNHGVFEAGAVLVGSHGYGVVLNRLGARALPYATEDVDIARPEPLAVTHEDLAAILREPGVDLVEVPSLSHRQPATSFKERGRAHFKVDLLAPARTKATHVVAVPELNAHALALPYLDYLLAGAERAMVMARHGCCATRVPLPERLAVHKLITSSLRRGRDAKAQKDVQQACVLLAALSALQPSAIEAAVDDVTRSARKHLKQGIAAAHAALEHAAPRALEELGVR